jgi:predicted metal-dependent peptidase
MWEDVEDDVVAKEIARDIVRKSKELCGKNYGNIPGEVIEQIDSILKREKPIVPWNRILRTFVASCAESVLDFTIKRVSKRYGTRPGTRKADVLNLAVAIDTSGSISEKQLQTFFSEIMWLWRNGVKITIYECDARIGRIYPFKGKFDGKVTGRGGTDLEPVLKAVEGQYDALIYFTDFYAPNIEKVYRIPILWVLDSEIGAESFPVKYGRKIFISDGKAKVA